MRFKAKPVEIEAHKWRKNGDHPDDDVYRVYEDTGEVPHLPREGRVVRYFRNPFVQFDSKCPICDYTYHDHGWIDEGPDGMRVCPGDWIILDSLGKWYPCNPKVFVNKYEPVIE